MFAIIISSRDQAGMTIKTALQQRGFCETSEQHDGFAVLKYKETKLYTIKADSVFFAEGDKIPADILVFTTKHQSKKGIPSLSTHVVGNWNTAEMGGKEKELVSAPAFYLKRALQLLEEKNIGYEVFQEVTHHGPSSTKPLLFVEIGSTPKEYANMDAGFVIADTIIDLLSYTPTQGKTAVGIGGLHHSPNFKKIQLNSDIAVAHICPKYALQFLTKEILLQAIEKTIPRAEIIILDWKSLGEEKERIKQLVDEVEKENNLKIMRTGDF